MRKEYIQNENADTVTYLPYYGGAKGQVLQIIHSPDGTISTQIIKSNSNSNNHNATHNQSQFYKDIKIIHETAQNIIKLQEIAKRNGILNDNEQGIYNKNMEKLNLSTKHLAAYQEDESEFDDGISSRSNLRFWFEKKKDKFLQKQSEENKEEENENGGGENENGNEETDEGVSINLPPEDASVAEAKPVGLAVAGPGGVAASKPIATAVVGPAGLAIARPVATAIAGVAPEDVMIPINADGYITHTDKNKDKKKKPSPPPNKEETVEKCDEAEENKTEKPKADTFLHSRLSFI